LPKKGLRPKNIKLGGKNQGERGWRVQLMVSETGRNNKRATRSVFKQKNRKLKKANESHKKKSEITSIKKDRRIRQHHKRN